MGCLRLVPFAVADGPHNMAADEALLLAAAEHKVAALRFYGWSEATVSLGYFQPSDEHERPPRLAQLPWVRRPSGGKTLVHHHELTYALALPPGFASGWMPRMHRHVILPALRRLGSVQVVERQASIVDNALCFQQHTPGDLVCAGHKIVGSAQRKHHQALLQHGSILLAQSEHTPELPGIMELTGLHLAAEDLQRALVSEFQRATGWELVDAGWTTVEQAAIHAMALAKYSAAEWSEKR